MESNFELEKIVKGKTRVISPLKAAKMEVKRTRDLYAQAIRSGYGIESASDNYLMAVYNLKQVQSSMQ